MTLCELINALNVMAEEHGLDAVVEVRTEAGDWDYVARHGGVFLAAVRNGTAVIRIDA